MILAIANGQWHQLVHVTEASLALGIGVCQLWFRWMWAGEVQRDDTNQRRGRWNSWAIRVWAVATAATAFAIGISVYHFRDAPLVFWLDMPAVVVIVAKGTAMAYSYFALKVSLEEGHHDGHGGGV